MNHDLKRTVSPNMGREASMSRPIAMTLISATILTAGCTSVKKQYHEKFQNEAVVSTSKFADSTIAMLGNLKLQFRRGDTVLIRRFVDHSAEPEIKAEKLHDDMLQGISAIVWYSVNLVDITQTGKTDAERVALYTAYLEKFRGRLLAKGRCNVADFDKALEEVSKQETLLNALQTAQPLLNTLITDAALQITELIDATQALALAIDERIDQDYAKVIQYRQTLEQEKFNILEAYEIIYQAYRSPEPNLDKLRESGVMWEPEIIPEGTPTRDDLKVIGEHLNKRLEALHAVQQEIEPDWNEYQRIHAELNKLEQTIIADAGRARVLMLTWVRAHQSLSQGTMQGAEWFDISELSKDLIRSAPDAILP